jgi:hypothetical protein
VVGAGGPGIGAARPGIGSHNGLSMLSLAQEMAPVPVQGRWPDDDRENTFYQEGISHQ